MVKLVSIRCIKNSISFHNWKAMFPKQDDIKNNLCLPICNFITDITYNKNAFQYRFVRFL